MEFKIKINELPTDIQILENKWVAFVIDTELDQVKVAILLRLGKSGKRPPRRIILLGWRSGQLGPEIEEVLSYWRRGGKFLIRAKRAEG
ncbi:MAG: hypothetical protein DRR19_22735 [Candidatus Parabeggiatoa sp. nov. 1]|nr:MAG: hypothetical protein DRR19_22735 [Gammaproteobacteria bacterium]